MGTIRLAFRAAWMVGLLLLCVPLHYAWKLSGRPSPWPRRFLGWVGRAAGMRVRVVGEPLERNVLFLANHLSWLDILLVAGASGAAFVAKTEVATTPVVGWLAKLNNTVFVARTERAGVRGQADALRAALAGGQPVALFPEGTTDGGPTILPFRASLLASLFPPLPRIRVQPIALDYGAAARQRQEGADPARDHPRHPPFPGAGRSGQRRPQGARPGGARRDRRGAGRRPRPFRRRDGSPIGAPDDQARPENLPDQVVRLPDERL